MVARSTWQVVLCYSEWAALTIDKMKLYKETDEYKEFQKSLKAPDADTTTAA